MLMSLIEKTGNKEWQNYIVYNDSFDASQRSTLLFLCTKTALFFTNCYKDLKKLGKNFFQILTSYTMFDYSS